MRVVMSSAKNILGAVDEHGGLPRETTCSQPRPHTSTVIARRSWGMTTEREGRNHIRHSEVKLSNLSPAETCMFSLIMNETAGRRSSFTAHVRTVNRADQRFPVDVWGHMYACSLHGDATTFQGMLQTWAHEELGNSTNVLCLTSSRVHFSIFLK